VWVIGSTPGPPNIPDEVLDPVTVVSPKLTKGKFCQGCHSHGRAMNNSKFYSNWPVESITKSHESSARAFENLASFHQVKKLKSLQNFRNSSKNHY
jgi:hypothetical protein